ncbi:MAG: L,D-transpeptidase family protein [Caulobacteraceae bacterium]
MLAAGAGVALLATTGFGGLALARQTGENAVSGSATPSGRQMQLLMKAIDDAPTHGFDRNEFATADLDGLVQSGDPGAWPLLNTAILAYARAQRGQRIPLSAFPAEWSIRPAAYDPAPELSAAIAVDGLGAWLDSLPPPYEGYQGLRASLATYRAIAANHGWKSVPEGAPLAAGAVDPRVGALRRRLAAEDSHTPEGDAPDSFDAPLTEALIRFQKRYGLTPDGIAGPPTIAAMNAPVGQRILQIKANMERWRWLPKTLPGSRVQVNISAAVMAVYQNDQPVMAMKAVAGKPGDETPMLSSVIQSVVLNPAWHVPDSIAKKEIGPKSARDHSYLAKNDFEVHRADDGVLHYVQKAGPKSALGRFKFDFSNPFGVYLHDTPAQSGFAHASRLSSHGCVRLEHPKALAELLLTGDETFTPDRIDEVTATDKTMRAPLAHPIPVFIFYWTAFVDGAGRLQFRNDAYDWDRKLLGLIAASKS